MERTTIAVTAAIFLAVLVGISVVLITYAFSVTSFMLKSLLVLASAFFVINALALTFTLVASIILPEEKFNKFKVWVDSDD